MNIEKIIIGDTVKYLKMIAYDSKFKTLSIDLVEDPNSDRHRIFELNPISNYKEDIFGTIDESDLELITGILEKEINSSYKQISITTDVREISFTADENFKVIPKG